MAAPPSNGDRPPLTPGLRRSSTLSTRSPSIREQATPDKTDAAADILYSHPHARIFSFSPPKESIKSKTTSLIPPDTDYPVDTVETLPWRSRTETTAAAGRLMIEKVRGSTNFLKCQNVMHAILRNSQCWCVDGESKFVLRVRAFQYYRIELPSTSDEDKSKVEELKKVLPTVLRYERTPCPFIRAFQVDLPDDAITPRRKGTWKRRESLQHNTPETDAPSVRQSNATRSWSSRTPPSAYPKNGPSYPNSPVDSVSSASPSVHRRGSLLGYSERPDSPASNAPSDDDQDAEGSRTRYGQEDESDPEEPPESPVTEDHRGRQTTSSKRDGRSVSVSARVAAFEIVRTTSTTRPRLDRDTSITRSVVDIRPPIRSSASSTSPLRVSQIPNSDIDVIKHPPRPEQASGTLGTLGTLGTAPPPGNDSGGSLGSNLDHDSIDQLPPIATESADLKLSDTEMKDPDHLYDSAGVDNITSDTVDQDQDETSHSHLDSRSDAIDTHEDRIMAEVFTNTDPLEDIKAKEVAESEELDNEGLGNDRQVDVAIPTQLEEHVSNDLNKLTLDGDVGGHDNIAEASVFDLSIERLPQRNIEIDSKHDGVENDSEDDNISPVSSTDSFHTMTSSVPQSPSDHEPFLSESPPMEQQNLFPGLMYRHKREESQMTVTASTTSDLDDADAETPLPREVSNQFEGFNSSALNQALSHTMTATTSAIDTGVRRRITQRRSFSPLAPASALSTGTQQQSGSKQQITRTILENIIIKPIEAVAFVVQVLSRIAGGATVNDLLSGELFRSPSHQRKISESANRQDGPLGNDDTDDDTDDDYGVPIRGRSRFTERVVGETASRVNGYNRDNDADSSTSVD